MGIEQQPPQYHQPAQWSGHPSGPLPAPGYYPPAGYAAPAYVVPTSGVAVASLVCSLIGLITFGLVAIAGVICGHIALSETRSGARGGHGLAVAGLIIGWIQCGGWLLFWFFMIVGAAAGV